MFKNAFGYVAAIMIDLIIVYGLVINRPFSTLDVDGIAMFGYGIIFYYIGTYIVSKETFGVSTMKFNKFIE